MMSKSSPAEYSCFVGIDIAADSFTAIWSTDGTMMAPYSPEQLSTPRAPAASLPCNNNSRAPVSLRDRPWS